MKTALKTAAFAVATALSLTAATAPAAQAETLWIPVENWSTWDVIYDIRIAGEWDPGWGPNRLYGDAVYPGFIFDVPVAIWDSCYVDIVIETDLMTHEAYGVNICDAEAIIISDGEAWIDYYNDSYFGNSYYNGH